MKREERETKREREISRRVHIYVCRSRLKRGRTGRVAGRHATHSEIVKTKRRRVSDVPITFARAARMTRLGHARQVNPLYSAMEGRQAQSVEGSDKTGDARWKFAFPASSRIVTRRQACHTLSFEITARN